MILVKPEIAAQELLTTVANLAKWRLRGWGPRFVKLGPKSVAYSRDEIDRWLEGNIRTSTTGGGKGGRRKREAAQQEVEK